MGDLLRATKMRAALQEAFRLAGEVNKYLDEQEPWFTIKSDREKASRSVYTALKAIDSLKIIFSPFLPYSSEKIHKYLGYEGTLFGKQTTRMVGEKTSSYTVLEYSNSTAIGKWKPSELSQGQLLRKPSPLFQKLDEDIVSEEMERLGG